MQGGSCFVVRVTSVTVCTCVTGSLNGADEDAAVAIFIM